MQFDCAKSIIAPNLSIRWYHGQPHRSETHTNSKQYTAAENGKAGKSEQTVVIWLLALKNNYNVEQILRWLGWFSSLRLKCG